MGKTLLKCGYGKLDSELFESCCLRADGEESAYYRCPVFDLEECPFGKQVKGCATCANMAGASEDANGNRIVDCEANDYQMYAPYAAECRHWVPAVG